MSKLVDGYLIQLTIDMSSSCSSNQQIKGNKFRLSNLNLQFVIPNIFSSSLFNPFKLNNILHKRRYPNLGAGT